MHAGAIHAGAIHDWPTPPTTTAVPPGRSASQASRIVAGTPTTSSILAAFKTGTHQNFLSHPYTCNGQAMKGGTAICNDNYLINQINNGVITQASSANWVTSKGYFPGVSG